MKTQFNYSNGDFFIDLTPSGSGKSYRATIRNQALDVEILEAKDGILHLLIDGKRVTAHISSEDAKRWITVNGETFVLTKSSGTRRGGHGHHHAAGALTAPMPGQVRGVNVGEGQAVTKGQTLLVLEAMKMEIRVHAPQDGTVKRLFVQQGQTVEREQILIEIGEN